MFLAAIAHSHQYPENNGEYIYNAMISMKAHRNSDALLSICNERNLVVE